MSAEEGRSSLMQGVRRLGKKVVAVAAAGLFVGSVVQAGLSELDDAHGSKLVQLLAEQPDDGDAVARENRTNPLDTEDDGDLATTSTSSAKIDYQRLNC